MAPSASQYSFSRKNFASSFNKLTKASNARVPHSQNMNSIHELPHFAEVEYVFWPVVRKQILHGWYVDGIKLQAPTLFGINVHVSEAEIERRARFWLTQSATHHSWAFPMSTIMHSKGQMCSTLLIQAHICIDTLNTFVLSLTPRFNNQECSLKSTHTSFTCINTTKYAIKYWHMQIK